MVVFTHPQFTLYKHQSPHGASPNLNPQHHFLQTPLQNLLLFTIQFSHGWWKNQQQQQEQFPHPPPHKPKGWLECCHLHHLWVQFPHFPFLSKHTHIRINKHFAQTSHQTSIFPKVKDVYAARDWSWSFLWSFLYKDLRHSEPELFHIMMFIEFYWVPIPS